MIFLHFEIGNPYFRGLTFCRAQVFELVDAEPEIVRINYRAMNDRFIRSFPLPEGLSKQTCAPPEIVQVVGDGEVAEEFSYASRLLSLAALQVGTDFLHICNYLISANFSKLKLRKFVQYS